jgi:hypothetical protein
LQTAQIGCIRAKIVAFATKWLRFGHHTYRIIFMKIKNLEKI